MPDALLVPEVTYGSGPEAVYIIECWTPGAYYVGISNQVEARLKKHWRDTFVDTRGPIVLESGERGAVRVEPNVLFMTTHGYRSTIAIIRVPTREAARKLECDWTYDLAGQARVVFGNGIESTCPGTRWLNGFAGTPWWDRNTVQGRAQTV